MTRKTLLTILIFFIAVTSFWFFSLKKDFKETKALLNEQLSEQQPTARAVTAAAKRNLAQDVVGSINSEKRKQTQAELEALQKTLAEEQQKLTSRQQMLASLKSRQAQEQPINYNSQIQERSEQISTLSSGLRDYRRAGDELSRRAAAALREQSSALNFARDQLDENIRIQEAQIRQTQEDLDYWTLNFNYLTEQHEHLNELRPLLEAQQQRLQEMRAQRLELSSTALLQTQNTVGQVQQVSGAYSQDQDDISDEIDSLRAEIQKLREDQNTKRMSLMTLSSQISQAQRDLSSQAQQIQALQNEIRLKQELLTKAE